MSIKLLLFRNCISRKKSVKSINQYKSVILTIYDIMKAHGGELKEETREEVGGEFIVQLPIVGITDYEDYTDGTD